MAGPDQTAKSRADGMRSFFTGKKSGAGGNGVSSSSWKDELKDKEDSVRLNPSATNPDLVDDAIELEERPEAGDSTTGGPSGSGGGNNRDLPKMGIDALIHDGHHHHHSAGAPDGSTVFYRVYKRRWFGVLMLTLLNIIVSWDWLTFAPVAGQAAAYFRTDESTINWLSIAFMLAFPVVSPAVIYVLHWGPKPSIMTSAALVLLGNWLRYGGVRAGDNGSFGLVMFGQILTGLAQPFVLAAPTRFSDLWFTNRGRVAATALMSLANPFGAALGQLVVPFMVATPEDVPSMVLYVAIISSVCAVPAFFIPAAPPTPVAPSGETPKANIKDSLAALARSLEFWLVLVPFSVYVGFFNSVSSLLNQIMVPYGYSDDDAGIAGAVMIVVGLVASAISSPIIDRTKGFVGSIKVLVPVIALSYVVFIWMPQTRGSGSGVAGPYVVLAVLGAASFSLLPVVVELLVEFTHPISPEVTSTIAWSSGQVIGACAILISDALKAGPDAQPPFNMMNALVFQAALAVAAGVPPMLLGMFGRADKISLRRVASDKRALDAHVQGPA